MVTTTEKVYLAIKSLFKIGKLLTIKKIAARVRMSSEGARRHIVLLTKAKRIVRKEGHIVGVK